MTMTMMLSNLMMDIYLLWFESLVSQHLHMKSSLEMRWVKLNGRIPLRRFCESRGDKCSFQKTISNFVCTPWRATCLLFFFENKQSKPAPTWRLFLVHGSRNLKNPSQLMVQDNPNRILGPWFVDKTVLDQEVWFQMFRIWWSGWSLEFWLFWPRICDNSCFQSEIPSHPYYKQFSGSRKIKNCCKSCGTCDRVGYHHRNTMVCI